MDLTRLLDGPVEQVAPRLLGATLAHAGVTVRLTEVEAYAGSDDPGSHAHRRRTARNATMFGPPGRLYVYFTYGMHHCANVVVGADGEPGAVLLRAGEVADGLDLARERRPGSGDRDLARGPARLCRALDLDLSHDGLDLAGLLVPAAAPSMTPPAAYATGPRVGLRHAAERPWRFWLEGEPTVSAYRPAAPRRAPAPPDDRPVPRRSRRWGRLDPTPAADRPRDRPGRQRPVSGMHILDDLEWRGLIAHSTDRDALRAAFDEGGVKFYVGFDPTAPSLHMGNLVQLVTAKRLQEAGHVPFALVGGATGMIGDPKESGERTLNSLDTVKTWVASVRAQIEPFLDFEGPRAATMVDNYDWTAALSTLDFLRDIGKHFPVNRMLARDVVRSRLEAGISYTEFSYVLLQSMDFLNLYRHHGVTLQFGGSDQWGNLTGGVELIRRSDGGRAHAFATPLVTRADGTKYGKTEQGALWLDPDLMSPYAFHQFWLNAEDAKVGELLRIFTFLPHEQIEELEQQTRDKPFLRAAQKALADEVTTLVHGEQETSQAKQAAAALFGSGDLRELRADTLRAALGEAGATSTAEPGSITDLLVETGLAQSRGEARRTVSEGGAYLNNERVTDPDLVPGEDDRLAGGWLVLRRGKKRFAGVEVTGAPAER